MVDDAIVVLENITRYREHGMVPMEAALKGASEIGSTVFSISISLVAVFIPILMMGGSSAASSANSRSPFDDHSRFHGHFADHHTA